MKQLNVYKAIFMGFAVIALPCNGQENTEGQTYRDSLYRHIQVEGSAKHICRFTYGQGSSTIDVGLGKNKQELSSLDDFIRQALNHPELYVCRIRLTGYSSIEGSYHLNEALSRNRVEGFYLYLRKHYPELYRYPHDLAWVAEDWKGLSEGVKQTKLNEREEILEIIRKVPGFDQREALLVKLNGGRPYQFIEKNLLPKLRRVEMEIEYTAIEPRKAQQAIEPTTSPPPSPKEREFEDTLSGKSVVTPSTLSFGEGRGEAVGSLDETVGSLVEVAGSVVPIACYSEPRFALKTNLLLWAGIQSDLKHTTPVANAALEYYINNRFSIEFGAMYSYWRYNANQEFQGISGYRIEPRYRFSLPLKRERMEIFLGPYARFGDYDRRNAVDKGQLTVDSYHADENAMRVTRTKNNIAQPTVNYQLSTVNCFTGDYWDAGLSGGLTIHLVGGLGLEVGARVGYVRSTVIKYTPEGDYNWFDSREAYNKMRVTDLNLNLVYRFR